MTRTLSIIAVTAAMLFLATVGEAHSSNGGWYQGGIGSSHRGGQYRNPSTGNHYRRHYR